MKITQLTDYLRESYFVYVGVKLSAMFALLVAWWQVYGGSTLNIVYFLGVALIAGVVIGSVILLDALPFKRQMRFVSRLIENVEHREYLGSLNELLKKARNPESSGTSKAPERAASFSRSDVIAIVSVLIAVASALFGYGQYIVASQSLQFAENPNPTIQLGSAQNVSLAYPWYTNPVAVSSFQDATIHFSGFAMTTTAQYGNYSIVVKVLTDSGTITNQTFPLTLSGMYGPAGFMHYVYVLTGVRIVKVALNHAISLQATVSLGSPGSPFNFYAYMQVSMEAILFRI